MATVTLRPDGDGTYTEYGTVYPSTPTTHYDKVDETTSDGDTTYIEDAWIDNDDTFTLTDSGLATGSTISNVRVYAKAKETEAGGKIALTIYNDTTLTVGTTQSLTASYADYYEDHATNPVTGSAWTIAEVDALEAGVRNEIIKNGRVTQVWVVVTYTAPAATAEQSFSFGKKRRIMV